MSKTDFILTEEAFFKDMDPHSLEVIAGCASTARFAADDWIFQEGEDATRFYLIRSGKVALKAFVPGRGEVTIQTIEPGDVLGWSWLLPPYHWHFGARALELTRAIAFDGECLRMKAESDHDLGYELFKRFSQKIIERLQATRLQLLAVNAISM
jgi:CRP/FNR family transcriptional regulator, cyclic AMP receptor protein